MSALEFAQASSSIGSSGPLLLHSAEAFVSGEAAHGVTLGKLRKRVDEELDKGHEICLISSSPKIAYKPVPGSSVIEDSAVSVLSLLEKQEVPHEARARQGWQIPAVSFGDPDLAISDILRAILDELGLEILAVLDHAIFETDDRKNFLSFLSAAEIEALRGAGLVLVSDDRAEFPFPRALNEFVDEVANALADVVTPQRELASVSDDLWYIERTIRRHLRRAAIESYQGRWRRNILHGDQSSKVLERARGDGNVTVGSVSQLRDPIEWLTLGELLEVVQSNRFGGLKFDDISWRRFASDVLPIRNRLSHMRILKKGDKETVQMWVARIRKAFD
jgi:hypothetical protein